VHACQQRKQQHASEKAVDLAVKAVFKRPVFHRKCVHFEKQEK